MLLNLRIKSDFRGFLFYPLSPWERDGVREVGAHTHVPKRRGRTANKSHSPPKSYPLWWGKQLFDPCLTHVTVYLVRLSGTSADLHKRPTPRHTVEPNYVFNPPPVQLHRKQRERGV